MTAASPRSESWLIAAQSVGGIAVGIAWLRSDSIGGWPLVAFLVLVAGTLLGIAASVALRGSFRVRPTPRDDARLVQGGIYRWLRHPMYVAVILIFAAAALSRPSTWVLLTAGLNLALYLGKARYEESVLMHHYPDYAQYREHSIGVRPLAGPGKRRGEGMNPDPDRPDPPSAPAGRA